MHQTQHRVDSSKRLYRAKYRDLSRPRSCCRYCCTNNFPKEAIERLVQEWDVPAAERRWRSFLLLQWNNVTQLSKGRPYVSTSGAVFDIRLTSETVTGITRVREQFPVCYTALCYLTGVDKSVWKRNALDLMQGRAKPSYVCVVSFTSVFFVLYRPLDTYIQYL